MVSISKHLGKDFAVEVSNIKTARSDRGRHYRDKITLVSVQAYYFS